MSDKKAMIFGCILLVAFSTCLYIGSNSDEVAIVLQKAGQICMECIGIG